MRHRADDLRPLHQDGGIPRSTLDESAGSCLPAEWWRAFAQIELDEDQVRHLVLALADRYGIALSHWTRHDIQTRLRTERVLTTEEWDRVIHTDAWGMLPVLAEDAVADSGQLHLAIRQAGLECHNCGLALPATSSVADTWSLCHTCRAGTTAQDILHTSCVGHIDGEHQRRDGHCHRCGVPMPLPNVEEGSE
ncbi:MULTISPECIES: hypothetical protein [unclassified Crossiella]|uniref:hypothetical protein n=1 Tax=unclassified Crossiella TaxID=2620835 RepID=UPI001FFECFC4|nr:MULTISPECIES: hypothetical protein [unclassified Crossiella]MCK2240961.1 hypothetical protein [Crossiella sp. S99.2]MCK2253895.1 hypothetical protein [Crossiella sp. S99.1]